MSEDLLEIVRNKKRSLLEDPISYAMSSGIIQEYGMQQDPQDHKKTLGSLASILPSRNMDAQYVKNFFGVESPNITRQESSMVASSILGLPEVGAAELGLLSGIHPQRHSDILDQVSMSNPSLGFALSVGREDPMSAELMLKGDRKIDSAVLKQNERQLADLKVKLFGGMDTVPDDYKNQVLRGALAYSTATGLDSLSMENQARRLSKIVDIDNGFEKYKTILPLGFTSSTDFLEFTGAIDTATVIDSTGDLPAFVDGSPALDNTVEDETLGDLVSRGKMVPVGDGKYELHVFGQPLKSSKNLNNNFVLDISKIKSILDSRNPQLKGV